jgi:hypothetical protein
LGLSGEVKRVQAELRSRERSMMSRAGRDYYTLISRAVDALHINVRETRLMLYERARRAQLGSFDPAIPEVEFRRERAALEKAIRAIETKAAAIDDGQAESDRKIVSDYASFLNKTTNRPDCFHDARTLPHSKETITAAIEREILRSTLEEDVVWLRRCGQFMWNYLEGIGPFPLPLPDVDQQGRTPTDPFDEYEREVERSTSFVVVAERESNEIENRIEAAIIIRRSFRDE